MFPHLLNGGYTDDNNGFNKSYRYPKAEPI